MLKKIISKYTVITHHSFIGLSTPNLLEANFILESFGFEYGLTFQIKTGSRYFFSLIAWDPLNLTTDKSCKKCVLFQVAGEESSFTHHSPEPWFTPVESCFSQGSCGRPVCESGICDSDFSSLCQLQKVKQMFPRLLQHSSWLIPRGKSEEDGDKRNSVSQATGK